MNITYKMFISSFIRRKGENQIMKINKGSKIGIIIQVMALISMLLLVLVNKIIPSVLVCFFSAGTITALIGTLLASSKNRRINTRL